MAGYDKLAQFFFERRRDTTRFDYNRDIEVPAMIRLLGDVKGKVILDVGCGFGDHISRLSKRGAKKLIGFDASKKLIEVARNRNISNAEFYVGSINRKLKFGNGTFDIVFSSLAFHHVKNLNQLYSEASRVLKKGGIFAFSTGHPVFDLVCQSPTGLIGFTDPKGKRRVCGKYFDESPKDTRMGSLGVMKAYSYTLETLIKTGLTNGFELADYVDAKPIPSSRRKNPETYKVTSTLPTFMLFKWKKKL
jgi:SAM-dependent methyltransferase